MAKRIAQARVKTSCPKGSALNPRGLFALLLGSLLGSSHGQEAGSSTGSHVLTNIAEIWALPPREKQRPQRLQTEIVIYYFDRDWKTGWGECNGLATFLPISDAPIAFKPGQKIALDGMVLPMEQRVLWEETKIEILSESVDLKPIPTKGHLRHFELFDKRLVEIEGLVDYIGAQDPNHVAVDVVSEGTKVRLLVLTPEQDDPVWLLDGAMVRVKGVYTRNLDVDEGAPEVFIWVADSKDVHVTGPFSADRRFAIPATSSDHFLDAPANSLIRIEGTLRHQTLGKELIVWDAAGQIRVRTIQSKAMAVGDRVEAIGYPVVQGTEMILRNALYRPLNKRLTPEAPSSPTIRLAAQVRELSNQEAVRGLPVRLRGAITWSHPGTNLVYIQDASGPLRLERLDLPENHALEAGDIVTIKGFTTAGHLVPGVREAVIERSGKEQALPDALPVTIESAAGEIEEGRLVEMRGYVKEAKIQNRLARLEIATAGGEFGAHLAWTNALESLVARGSGRSRRVPGKRWPEVGPARSHLSPDGERERSGAGAAGGNNRHS